MWPFNKGKRNGTRMKKAIANGLYKSFGEKTIRELPINIKNEIDKNSERIAMSAKQRGRPPTQQELQYMSRKVSENTQRVVAYHANNEWQKFQNREREAANKMINPRNNLSKRDFIENFRNKFKFFREFDEAKYGWIHTIITALLFIAPAFFLPQMAIVAVFWQTVISYFILMPIVNKLFKNYYFWEDTPQQNGIGQAQSMGPQQFSGEEQSMGAYQGVSGQEQSIGPYQGGSGQGLYLGPYQAGSKQEQSIGPYQGGSGQGLYLGPYQDGS